MKDPSTWAQDWANAMGSAQTAAKYKAGVQAVTVPPNATAAAQAQKYANNTAQAVQNGTYQRANLAVGLQGWQQPTLAKGSARLADGARQALPKMTTFVQQYAPKLAAAVAKVRAMPNNTPADADARNLAMSAALRAMKGTFKTQGG